MNGGRISIFCCGRKLCRIILKIIPRGDLQQRNGCLKSIVCPQNYLLIEIFKRDAMMRHAMDQRLAVTLTCCYCYNRLSYFKPLLYCIIVYGLTCLVVKLSSILHSSYIPIFMAQSWKKNAWCVHYMAPTRSCGVSLQYKATKLWIEFSAHFIGYKKF